MTTQTRQEAQAATKLIEDIASAVLPVPSADLVDLSQADAPTAEKIRSRMAQIDLRDTNSIVTFGASAQAEMQQISQAMLQGVKNKDVGPAGDSLREIVGTIRGFSVDELDPNRKPSWWERLFGKAKPIHDFMARYEVVQDQIDRITENLLGHEHALMKDIKSLDKLYEKTLVFYHELALFIAAGEEKLRVLDVETIPALDAAVRDAAPTEQVLKAQELRDLRAARDDLERRVHDLKLTRQVTMQSLPSIRLVQENDKSLVTKINSTLVNTVPLWETQLAQAVTIQRSTQAAQAVREATDLTNSLLSQNAANLRDSNRMVRAEMERGVFDINAIKAANADLIATIEESLQIAEEGKRRRAAAEAEMAKMELELRDTLAASGARTAPAAPPAAAGD